MSSRHRFYVDLTAWLKAMSAAVALGAVALLPQAAQAGTTPALFKSFAGNVNFVTTGNTLRAGDNTSNATASSLLSGNSGDPVDAGSSSETISVIPAGSTIEAAYLYWAGSGATPDYTVTLNGNTVTAPANRQYTETYNAGGGDVLSFFSGAADVTSIVTGNGTYTFAGMNVTNVDVGAVTYFSNQATTAGWAILVVYSNSTTETNRVINVFEGFQAFRNTSINLTMNNFMVPASGINAKFAVLTWEGDPNAPSNTGETLGLTPGSTLSDACNTNGNQYNSTINTLICTGNAATDDVFYGVDYDTYNVGSMFTSGETSVTTNYASGNDLVLLSAQIISISNTPVSDLAITKSHSGTLAYGANASWTLAVTNNGPATTPTGAGITTTVTDTLPTGVTYVSATGSGWTCGAAGQVVTCTNPSAVASGANFPNITLTAFIGATAVSPLANTATVTGTNGNFDNNSGNNSSTDSAAIVAPDLSTSAKVVVNTGGGDAVVGSTLQYTITLTETGGVAANGASVTDDVPAHLSNFTVVSIPAGATNSSTGAGTGANNDGKLNITGITVPANGSVTIVFTAQVAAGTANCTAIDNTATVTNPFGNGATPSSSSVVVAQSSCASSGNKVLYLYSSIVAGTTHTMSRQPTGTNTSVSVAGAGAQVNWEQQPVAAKNIVLAAQNVTVTLYLTRSGTNSNRTVKVGLALNSAPATVLGSQTLTFNPGTAESLHTFTFAIPATTVTTGDALLVEITNTTAGAGNTINVFPLNGAASSNLTFATSTVINVDSVTAYNAAYPSTTQPANGVFVPGQTVFLCAVVSDPFGSADTDPATGGTAPKITLTDPNGTVQVSGAAMTNEAAANCAGTASTATEAFEYSYITSFGLATGFWTASVTATEGTEGTVTQTSNGSFDLDVPSLLITKTASVATDPVEGATRAKAIPGATVTYTVTVQNNGRGPVDNNALVISDPIPANTAMSLTAKPPFTFTNGATSSGLSVTAGSDANITYSNNGGTTFTYVPSCTRPCTDTAITNFKITLTGSMNGKTGASAPSFNITFNVVIQ